MRPQAAHLVTSFQSTFGETLTTAVVRKHPQLCKLSQIKGL